MLSTSDFVRQSLDIHLFFARIMKEHSFFLQVGFTPKDTSFAQQADAFRKAFDQLLGEVVSLSGGVASPGVLQSGEVVTPYTLQGSPSGKLIRDRITPGGAAERPPADSLSR